MIREYFYLIEIQYLGFRYHGWQKQPEVNTVQRMVERTLNYVLDHDQFKVLVTGRTDAIVSANQSYFELFLKEPINPEKLMIDLNINLPSDIKILSVSEVDSGFNIIQSPKQKEYIYLFSFGAKNHPFAAPFMCYIQQELDIELMKEAAKCFEGRHNFQNYCYKPSDKTVFDREISLSEIVKNDLYTASFFPDQSFLFKVRGKGFMRHQVRMMMGALIKVGEGLLTIDDIKISLSADREKTWNHIAPAYGLILNSVEFEG